MEKKAASVTEPEPSHPHADDNVSKIGRGLRGDDLVLALTLVNQARAIGVLGSNLALGAERLGLPTNGAVLLASISEKVADTMMGFALEKWGDKAITDLTGGEPYREPSLVLVP